MFVDCFSGTEDNEPFSIPRNDDHPDMDVLDTPSGDIGVESMRLKSAAELTNLLGFVEGRPAHWCKIKCHDPAITSWEDKHKDKYEHTNQGIPKDGMSSLSLLWHQAVGIASMAEKAWTETETAVEQQGFILADGVGVGKTAQVMGFIALVQQVWTIERGNEGGSRPPVLGES
jgi:hypothetical protein